jgi:hypothetical protein
MVESASCINPPPHRAVLTKAHRGQGNDARHILAIICAAICSQGTSDCPPLHAAAARGQQTTYCNTAIPVHQSIIHPTTYRYMHTFIHGNGDQAVKGGRSGQLAIV